ncbi:MAG: pitrilysin family protein [Pyrinomonadaceae bacterium]
MRRGFRFQISDFRLFCRLAVGVFLIVLVGFSVNVSAQEPKATPPEGGTPKPFKFPAQKNFTLKNGMEVTMVQYGSIPKVSFQAVIRAGTKDDAADKKDVSSLTGDMLKEGTKTLSAEDIARQVAEMGGNLNVGVGTDSTNVSGQVLSEFDARFVKLLADIIINPKFEAADFERLRADELRNLAIQKTQAGSQASEKFRQVFFGEHPYGKVNPTESEAAAFSLEDVRKFYDENYGAARTHLYIVGQFDESVVRKAIEEAFSKWKAGEKSTRNVPKVDVKYSLNVIDRPGAPQSTIYMGVPAPSPSDPDFIKFAVMNSLLGGSFGSRITSNIREDKGYTYSPGSFVWNRFKTAYWAENADVTTQFTGASIKEILAEIDRLQKEPPSREELQGIKNYMVGIYTLQNSSRGGVINQLENANYNELGVDSINSYIDNVVAVTPKDVQEMARKYLQKDRMTIVVVGDKSKITEQLKPYMAESGR